MTRPSESRSLSDEEAERLLDSWKPERSTAPVPGPPSSEHARLELAHAVRAGHRPGETPPLAQDDPVPGCRCPRCELLSRGASLREVEWVEDVLRDLARIDPPDRLRVAGLVLRAAADLPVPSAGWLCRRAPQVPGARGSYSWERSEDPPPLEKVRRTPILAVARRLGLGEPTPHGHQYRMRCPLHRDDKASLELEPGRRRWYCWPCSLGGNGIDLVMASMNVSKPEAAKWIAGGMPR